MQKIFILFFCLIFIIMSNIEVAYTGQALDKILKNGVLRVGVDAGYIPFVMKDKKGELIGFDIDFSKLMSKNLGVELKVVNIPWDIIIDELMADQCDIVMAGITTTLERNLKVNFTDPYIVAGQTALVNKKLEGSINDFRDLNSVNYIITTKSGVTALDAVTNFLPRAKIKIFDNEITAIMDVVEGRADAFIYDSPFNIVLYPRYRDKLFLLDKPFTYEPLSIALNQGDPDFLNWLNNFIRIVKGDGTFEALYNKWFVVARWWENVE